MNGNVPQQKRYCLLALGSRGDVQPFIALGCGLRTRGNTVVIAAAEDYRALVCQHGLEFAPLVGRIADLMDRAAVADALDGGPLGSLRLALRLRTDAAPLLNALFTDTLAAARGSDVLMVSTLGQYIGGSIAEALGGISVVTAHFHPYSPSRYYAHMFFPPWPLGHDETRTAALYNNLTHHAGINGFWHLLRPLLNKARKQVLGLPPLTLLDLERFLQETHETGLHLHAYSSRLAPPPPDWNPNRHIVTGYWRCPPTPQEWSPPPAVRAFLDTGMRPVYIGFGSILAGRDPDKMTRLLTDALHQAGMRGILYRGWGDLGNIALPPTVFAVDSMPHDWLFPRCAAVIHHGGAGTTAAALCAKTPAIVVPIFGDQRFWANQLYREGASPPPLPRNRLTAQKLTDAITRIVSEAGFQERTQVLRTAIKAENGVENALLVLEKWLS